MKRTLSIITTVLVLLMSTACHFFVPNRDLSSHPPGEPEDLNPSNIISEAIVHQFGEAEEAYAWFSGYSSPAVDKQDSLSASGHKYYRVSDNRFESGDELSKYLLTFFDDAMVEALINSEISEGVSVFLDNENGLYVLGDLETRLPYSIGERDFTGFEKNGDSAVLQLEYTAMPYDDPAYDFVLLLDYSMQKQKGEWLFTDFKLPLEELLLWADTESPSPDNSPSPVTSTTPTNPELTDDQFVEVKDHLPGIYVDLKYAGEDNFTGEKIYEFTEAYLRYGTVKKLATVQESLLEKGYSLKIWDAHRPVSAQFKLWEVCPDPSFVANPNNSYSNHSRGNTVDVTLVLADGESISMPTGFDDFSAMADRDYSDVPSDAIENIKILEDEMTAAGFTGYSKEWWHYSDNTTYPVAEFSPSEEDKVA